MSKTLAIARSGAPVGNDVEIAYLLRAPGNGDQEYDDDQVLDTEAEGVTAGQLTVYEDSGGTVALVSGRFVMNAGGNDWTYAHMISQAIARQLGTVLLVTIDNNGNMAGVALQSNGFPVNPFPSCDGGGIYISVNTVYARCKSYPQMTLDNLTSSQDYVFAIVLGGYDSNGVPYHTGAAGSFDYGWTLLCKGHTEFPTWHLLYRFPLSNTATLYTHLADYAAGASEIYDPRVPDLLIPEVLQPIHKSTFTGSNGTSIDELTPEVGSAFSITQGAFTVQGNRVQTTNANAIAVTECGVADGFCRVTGQATANDRVGVVLRYTDVNNQWRVYLRPVTGKIQLYEVNGGGGALRAEADVELDAETDYEVTVIADGSTISAWVDGQNKISYASATHNQTATKWGLITVSAAPVTVEWDNFHVHARTSSAYDNALDAL